MCGCTDILNNNDNMLPLKHKFVFRYSLGNSCRLFALFRTFCRMIISRQVNVSLQCNFKNLQQTQPIEASRTHGGQKRRESESLVLTNLKRSGEGHRTTQNLTSIDRYKNIMMVSFWLRITALLRTEHLDGDEQCPLQLSDLLEKVTEAERAAAAFRSWTSSLSGFPFRSILARIETPSGESHTIYTHRYGREL